MSDDQERQRLMMSLCAVCEQSIPAADVPDTAKAATWLKSMTRGVRRFDCRGCEKNHVLCERCGKRFGKKLVGGKTGKEFFVVEACVGPMRLALRLER